MLRSDLADPLASPLVQDVLELFLARGYEVVPTSADAAAGEALVLDLRTSASSAVLILRRGSDGAVVALERWTGSGERGHSPEPGTRPPPMPSAPPAPERARPTTAVWDLEEPFRRFAWLKKTPEGAQLALLYDDRLELAELSPSGIAPVGSFRVPFSSSRGLHVDAADLDGDGVREVAALWAEDVHSVDQGVDSKLHSWVFTASDETLAPVSGDLAAHLRIAGPAAYAQERGPFSLYRGPVFRLQLAGRQYERGSEPTPWGQANLFELTPFGSGEALVWAEEAGLNLVSVETGRPVPGRSLLGGLGPFRGPEVAVRLRTPEYRTGFGTGGQVAEKYHGLPQRLAILSDGTAYTVHRGRSKGLPLIGQPAGRDSVVRVVRDREALRLERPFEPVEAFIVDFALVDTGEEPPSVLLLLNDKEDGSGRSYLLSQSPNQYYNE
ncbi:MAG: hypothetical protein SCH98_16860 [Deferrisomatales bacterium]|nr:hypothetical protein [Deferrisomatales bacterium]